MADGREPVALAMVLCDAIHRDLGSGKCTLLGTFSVLQTAGFPVIHPVMSVYVCLTECRGKVPFTIKIVDVNEERDPVFQRDGEVMLDDPLGIVELTIGIGMLVFPAAGEYRVQLLTTGHPLIERRLIVVQHGLHHEPEGEPSDE